jgi:HAMP domain-containing protein
MHLTKILHPFNRATNLLTSFSVRTRIVILALIPVVGFLANGLTYVSGEGEVASAFQTVKQSNALADASRDFKSSISAIRLIVKDFSTKPSDSLVEGFEKAHALALRSLDTIAASIDARQAENTKGLRADVLGLRSTFHELVQQQTALGFDESTGLRRSLASTGNAVERIINENMTWLAETEATKLMMSLLIMRHHEADYRLNQRVLTLQQFRAAYKQFTDTFGLIDGTVEMKSALEQQVKNYADTFVHWADVYDQVHPLRAVIEIDSQRMMPRADEIIDSARQTAAKASSGLIASQGRTRTGIIAVGIAMVALGLGFSWLIGRSITFPLHDLADVMKRLANGDTSARIPATEAHDEIGEMARTVIVFRDTMIERESLAQTQAGESRAKELRSDTISMTIAQFKHSVETVLGKLRAASMKLEMSSTDLNKAADTVSSEAHTAKHGVRERNRGGEFGGGIGGFDRRDCLASGEIDRRGRPRGLRSAADRHHDVGARAGRHAHRRGGRIDPGHRRPDQSARPQRHHRGRPRRRIRPGLRGGRGGGKIAGRSNRQSDRGDRRTDRRDPIGRGRRRASHRAGQLHHLRHVVDRHHGGRHRRSAELGGRRHFRRRQPRLRRSAHRRRGDEPGGRRYHQCPRHRLRR